MRWLLRLYDNFYRHYSLSELTLAAGGILFSLYILYIYIFIHFDAQGFSARKRA